MMFDPGSVEFVARRARLCSRLKNFTLDTANEEESVLPIEVHPAPRRGMFGISCMIVGDRLSDKPSYNRFLSREFNDTIRFDHIRAGCPQEEIEGIKNQLSHYTFIVYCGRGEFGSVWLVKDLFGRTAALKLVRKQAVKQLETEKEGLMIYRERIRNFEHLVQIYDVGETEDFFYYTMEAAYSISDQYYVPVTLARLLEHCFFYPEDCAAVLTDVLKGLKLLHANDLAHRDVKPENIILADGKIKICDFSLISSKGRKSYAGTELFVPQDLEDIPPEQFGTDCDLFAAGKVLYALLANEEDISKFPQINRKFLQNDLAKKLNHIINRACEPSFKNRFSSAGEFIQALKQAGA